MRIFHQLAVLFFILLGGATELLVAQTTGPLPPLDAGDVLIQARADGFHLWVRKQSGVQSVMLTESYEDPHHALATYALRAVGPNPLNDQEPRLLNGKFLPLPHHSLMSSTARPDPQGRSSFEIVIPPLVEYGSPSNPNSRYGRWNLSSLLGAKESPVWFSIRTFTKSYGDYSGAYRDNAFSLRALEAQQIHTPDGKYEAGLVEGFSRLGPSYQAGNIQDAIEATGAFLNKSGESLEVVVAIDTTQSMGQNLAALVKTLVPTLRKEFAKYSSVRVGLVFYRDYMEDYLTQTVPFTADLNLIQAKLESARSSGGGDIPEAVVEALWAGLNSFSWTADQRVLLLMGDAPQHPIPRGAVTEAMVRESAHAKNVELHLIMLPQTGS